MKTSFKIFGETRGKNQYDLVIKRIEDINVKCEIENYTLTDTNEEYDVVFEDGSRLTMCDRGYEKAVQLSLFC